MISFNRSQRLGLNLDQHIALDAGAGTGKTTVMAERYVQHLLSAEQRATYVLPPPIRQEPIGAGLMAAKRDRTPLNEWKGLLPQRSLLSRSLKAFQNCAPHSSTHSVLACSSRKPRGQNGRS